MKIVVFPNILVSLGQNKNISMKTVARTFLLLFLCSLQGKAAFYSDKAANLLNTLDSLIENYPQVIEQRQSAINRIASKPMPNTLQARYEHNKRLFQE